MAVAASDLPHIHRTYVTRCTRLEHCRISSFKLVGPRPPQSRCVVWSWSALRCSYTEPLAHLDEMRGTVSRVWKREYNLFDGLSHISHRVYVTLVRFGSIQVKTVVVGSRKRSQVFGCIRTFGWCWVKILLERIGKRLVTQTSPGRRLRVTLHLKPVLWPSWHLRFLTERCDTLLVEP